MNISNQAKFIGAIVLQVLIILIIIIFKVSVLSGGTDVMLKILPVDPRDPLRGDYVTFQYEISSVSSYLFGYGYSKDVSNIPSIKDGRTTLPAGETIYVTLNNTYGGSWDVIAASTLKPADGSIFIKGVVEDAGFGNNGGNSGDTVNIRYGVEEYFIPEGQGKSLNLWDKNQEAYAKVTLDKDGNAVLKQLYIDGQPWP